jgi:hypothetical protein
VAKAFDARCTPDLFIFDSDGKLAYRGQFDDARPGNQIPVTGRDARAAVDTLVAGGSSPQRKRSKSQHRLQHQVEARQRAGVS